MTKLLILRRAFAAVRASVFLSVLITLVGIPGLGFPVEFRLTPHGGEPPWTAFTLAPPRVGPAAAYAAYIEDGMNAALGMSALKSNVNGTANVAVGTYSLTSNIGGTGNTAVGQETLWSNTSGLNNVAVGNMAMWNNTIGRANSAFGLNALYSNGDGEENTALGSSSLHLFATGNRNTAVGTQALYNMGSGLCNTALGYNAGVTAQGGNYNIFIGANSIFGGSGATNTISIGTPYQAAENPPIGQNRTYIAGITNKSLVSTDWPSIVGITPAGQLGVFPFDLLPSKGDQGDPGPPGPAGEGLISGSLLFLVSGISAPAGYVLLGSTEFSLNIQGEKRPTKLTVNVFKKQ